MSRNRDKLAKSEPFSSIEMYDAAMREENSRYMDALNALTRKYGAEAPKMLKHRAKNDLWMMSRIGAKYDMEERHHEALLAKVEARKPEAV